MGLICRMIGVKTYIFHFLQIICSCSFLYVLRRWKLISFSSGDNDNSTGLVSLQTVIHTSPLALTYLLYMVCAQSNAELCLYLYCFCFVLMHLMFLPFCFLLKASHYGVCSRSKCTHVHHAQEDNSGIYNVCGVYLGGSEV